MQRKSSNRHPLPEGTPLPAPSARRALEARVVLCWAGSGLVVWPIWAKVRAPQVRELGLYWVEVHKHSQQEKTKVQTSLSIVG